VLVLYPFLNGQGGISACPLTSTMLCSIWGRCSWLWLWCCVVDFRHVLWTITCIIYAFLCLVDNCNEICVIVMYKFSGGHAKNLCYFLLQITSFLQKSTDFPLNLAKIRWPIFCEIWLISVFTNVHVPSTPKTSFGWILLNFSKLSENQRDR
jgi:hypothetical protein